MTNNVQSLYSNGQGKARGRGRPKSFSLEFLRTQLKYEKYSSRQSIHNKANMFPVGMAAVEMGLVDSDYRDKATGKRSETKMAAIGKLHGAAFFSSDKGKQWLADNWENIIDSTTAEIIEWVRAQKQQEE